MDFINKLLLYIRETLGLFSLNFWEMFGVALNSILWILLPCLLIIRGTQVLLGLIGISESLKMSSLNENSILGHFILDDMMTIFMLFIILILAYCGHHTIAETWGTVAFPATES